MIGVRHDIPPGRRKAAALLPAVLVCSLILGAPRLHGYVSEFSETGVPVRWNLITPSPAVHTNVLNRATRSIRYFLAADAYSAANRTAELNAARACFAQWQSVPGTLLKFEEGGLAAGQLDVNVEDNTNLVYWAKTSTLVNGGLDNIGGATGVTFTSDLSDGTQAEADIVLNGVPGIGYTWFTDFNNSANAGQFVESILLHEIGHLLGLAHSPAGGATMFVRGGPGVSTQAGLSLDEITALHALYPSATVPATLGRVAGFVVMGSTPISGAIVSAENAAGNLVASTVSRANGLYELPALPPGAYQVRATPMDPSNRPFFLLRGTDIAYSYTNVFTGFLPSPNTPTTVLAGGNALLNFIVAAGNPPLRINRIWPPTTEPASLVIVNYAETVPAGAREVAVGVYCLEIPSPDAVLRVTGDGLTFGPTSVKTNAFAGLNPPLHLVSVPMQIADTASPGLRSLALQQSNVTVYANGFIEIPPPFPDFNFDGLDDRFQRLFPLWTGPEAAPHADPDQDGYDNTAEYIAGSNPTDPLSVLRVESVRLDAAGATLTWPSAPGRRYQVLSQPRIEAGGTWQKVGNPVLAEGNRTEFLDPTARGELLFYRVEALP